MSSTLLILAAVVGGWVVQLYLTYQQSMAFNRQVLQPRSEIASRTMPWLSTAIATYARPPR